MTAPKFKQLKPAYGFDEVAIVPGDVTVNPEQTDVSLQIGNITLDIPILASAMDGVTAITPAHLDAAMTLGRFLAGCAYRLLGDLGASSDCRLETMVDHKLREANGLMTRKQLRQTIGGRVSGEKLDRVLNAMERNGLIQQTHDTTVHGASRLVKLT